MRGDSIPIATLLPGHAHADAQINLPGLDVYTRTQLTATTCTNNDYDFIFRIEKGYHACKYDNMYI